MAAATGPRRLAAAALAAAAALTAPAAPAAATPRAVYDWELSIKTGDNEHAGTSARVYLTLYGSKGRTAEIQLDDPKRNDFERGNTDGFVVKTPVDIGARVEKVKIRHDNSGKQPGWYLDRIHTRTWDASASWTKFHFYRWLAKNEADGAICLTQKPTAGDPDAC
ncbi:hypothetical protein GCM10010123_40800 [Pilimelia anulata]|uniref:PLAT domain-containing protein n=1 Tax=Pilimelia anulata TaxID=53371 RepID=A0A8J3BBD8_9ACTN|nr:PLAT/LH2 domain-containing protein [Pilimelia anulata]GGK06888.1 hypothetical protein GCM10010123_40800 [Pilimelia anulata]